MHGVNSINISVASAPDGAVMTVTVADPRDVSKLDGLGFIGVMTLGMHHQGHRLLVVEG